MRARRVFVIAALGLAALLVTAGVAQAVMPVAKCSVSISSHYPKRSSNVTAKARVLDGAGHPISGARVVFAWRFKSGTVSETRFTNSLGVASSTRTTGSAPSTYRVFVRATSSSGGVTRSAETWFLPGASPGSDVQKLSIAFGSSGYVPSRLTLMAGRRTSVLVPRGAGCFAGLRIPQLKISADNSQGPVSVTVPALSPGTYRFTCGMGMLTGYLVAR